MPWGDDDFARVVVQPRTPPTEGAVGYNVVLARGHQQKILVCICAGIVFNELCVPNRDVGFAPDHIIREKVEDRVSYAMPQQVHGFRVIGLGQPSEERGIGSRRIITPAHMNGYAMLCLHRLL